MKSTRDAINVLISLCLLAFIGLSLFRLTMVFLTAQGWV